MLRQRQICLRQRYGGRGKINRMIYVSRIGTEFDGFFARKKSHQTPSLSGLKTNLIITDLQINSRINLL